MTRDERVFIIGEDVGVRGGVFLADDDDTRYRPREEIEEARKRDPLRILSEQLMGQGILSEEQDKKFREDAQREVNEATDIVEAAPYPSADDFYDHVYAPQK